MSQFVYTSSGFINLDHILLIRVGVEREEGEDLIQMSDGRIVQCVIYDRGFLPPKPPAAMVAATEPASPQTDVGFGPPNPDDPKPKYADEAAAEVKPT